VGIVETGSERIVHAANPWEALGYQAVDEFITLFDQRAFAAAMEVARRARERVTAPDRKRALSALENLAAAFDAWDRFDHARAKQRLAEVRKGANDLQAAVGVDRADRILRFTERHGEHLERLVSPTSSPTEEHVRDLLANAKRRQEEGRIDDAVARLYRAIEAIAQGALAGRHGIPSTERVPVDRLPEPIRSRLEVGPKDDGTIRLGLQDAYALLAALGDQVGTNFTSSELCDPQRSPLTARNRSILAHGFERVPDAVFDRLWSGALALAETKAEDLPTFPELGGGQEASEPRSRAIPEYPQTVTR
jgi:CRISPR-associated protein (TIGR02710 family)